MSKELLRRDNDDSHANAVAQPSVSAGKTSEKFSGPIRSLPSPSKTSDNTVQKKQETPLPFITTLQAEQKERADEGNLPADVRSKMEKSFAADFSDVKVHQDSEAAKNLNAIAFTQGDEVHFASGYNPYSQKGQEFLGHELSHVIQQKAGLVETTHQEQGFNVNYNEAFEAQADAAGKKAASGQFAGMGSVPSNTSKSASVQKKSSPIQLLRQPIPGSGFILDVNTTPDIVLENLINAAASTDRQYSDVNWRQLFYPAIEAQVRGRQLGSISHAWTDTSGIDIDWEVNISFSVENPVRTSRPDEVRAIATTQGGSATPSLGSSQTVTTGQTAGAQVSGTNAPGGVGFGGNTSAGVSDSTARGQLQGAGGGLTGGQSQTSQESVSRYRGNLLTSINVRSNAGYSNWDLINPVKWGAHLSGTHNTERTVNIGTITYDQPNF